MRDTTDQLKQKVLIEEFISSVNLFIGEYYIETLEQKLGIVEVYLHACQSWTIEEKDEIIEKLYDMELALFDRIKEIKPDAITIV